MFEKIPEIGELVINGKTLRYVGTPLTAFSYRIRHGNIGGLWGGKSNILQYAEKTKSVCLKDLDDCFDHLKLAHQREGYWYIRGYVLDYITRSIYYDDGCALEFARKAEDIEFGLGGYFVHFIKKDFSI